LLHSLFVLVVESQLVQLVEQLIQQQQQQFVVLVFLL